MIGRPRLFGRNAATERTVVRGPHPVAIFENATVDGAWGASLRGRAGGAIVIGEPSSPTRKYSGELGPHQSFRGGVPLAAFTADRKGFNTALPNTHGPVTETNTILDLFARMP
jgi:hypothetical protein